MKKTLFLILSLFVSLVHAQTTSANFSSNAQLNGFCLIETNAIDLSSNVSATINLGSYIFLTCSKNLSIKTSFTNASFSSTNLNHFYLVGNNPTNTDKLVISFRSGVSFVTNDGTISSFGTIVGTGVCQPLRYGLNNLLLIPQGSMINDEFKTSVYNITPDTYSSNFTILLYY